MKRLKNLKRIIQPDKSETSVYTAKYGKINLAIYLNHRTHETTIFKDCNAKPLKVTWDGSEFETWLNEIINFADPKGEPDE